MTCQGRGVADATFPITLDDLPAVSRSVARTMTDDDLRNQDWALLTRQLTHYAFRRSGRRSWEHAEDLAQTAIADVFYTDNWDPKTPLLKVLATRVLGHLQNSARRHRSRFEVAMDDTVERVTHPDGTPDDAVADQDEAAQFRTRLRTKLADDAAALEVVALMVEGVETLEQQVTALGRPLPDVRNARQRVFRHAESVRRELAALDEPSEESCEQSTEGTGAQ